MSRKLRYGLIAVIVLVCSFIACERWIESECYRTKQVIQELYSDARKYGVTMEEWIDWFNDTADNEGKVYVPRTEKQIREVCDDIKECRVTEEDLQRFMRRSKH
jgi:hypothetical protein